MQWLQSIFQQAPEIALFLSLAGGYALGKIQFGKFQLGGGRWLTARSGSD